MFPIKFHVFEFEELPNEHQRLASKTKPVQSSRLIKQFDIKVS